MNLTQVSINSDKQSNIFYRTWLDIMPEEIQQLIWKIVNKNVMESIILFGRYKIMFKLALTGPAVPMSLTILRCKVARMPRISNTNSFNSLLFDNGEKCDSESMLKIKWWINEGNIELSACGLLNIKYISQLYQLCKHIDNDWNYLGFIENVSASRYTYSEHSDLDNALKAFN